MWYMKWMSEWVKLLSRVRLCNPVDLPGSFVQGILQARILEWVAISFSRGSSWPRDQTQDSCTACRHFNLWAILVGYSLNQFPLLSGNTNELYFPACVQLDMIIWLKSGSELWICAISRSEYKSFSHAGIYNFFLLLLDECQKRERAPRRKSLGPSIIFWRVSVT